MTPLDLPPGLTTRPLTLADAAAVAALIVAEELVDVGTSAVEAADLLGFWERPSFDLATGTVGVFAGDQLVAFAELVDDAFGTAGVHPDERGRGLGTALARWLQTGARERGLEQIGTQVPQGSPADVLLAKLGYRESWTSWDLALPARAALVPAAPPDGYTLRAAEPTEVEACWTVIEDAFLEWSHRQRRPLEDWASTVTGRPDFEPWHLRVATDPSGAVVAAAVLHRSAGTVLIDQLATRADQRGRGLASALITDAVTISAQRGATAWTISTDARSGARSLYERIGMQVTSTWVYRQISLA